MTNKKIPKQGLVFLGFLVGIFLGFFVGNLDYQAPKIEENKTFKDISIVNVERLEGDSLIINTSGPVRILWGENFAEGDGEHRVPLGNIFSKKDLDFENFAYVGNTKSKKFYNADSYHARGTHPENRRFFKTKIAAEAAGFVASKTLK